MRRRRKPWDADHVTDDPRDDATALAELVSSRLCHDLINPVGAIGNGIELLAGVQPASPELELVAESTAIATARIRFYRIAFGAARASETVEGGVLDGILRAMHAGGRLEIGWTPRALHRPEARLMFLGLLCAESAMPVGGRIEIDIAPPQLEFAVAARRTRFETAPWAHLVDGVRMEECASAQVHFLLARRFLAEAGRAARLAETDGGFTLALGPA